MGVTARISFKGPTHSVNAEAHDGVLRLEVVCGALVIKRRFRDGDLMEFKRVVDAAVATRGL